jgi:hypothetical protein
VLEYFVYDSPSLRKTIKKHFDVGNIDIANLADECQQAVVRIASKDRQMEVKEIQIKKFTAYQPKDPVDDVLCCHADFELRRVLRVRTANRNDIIATLKEVLNDGVDLFLVRADISKFYESLDQNRIRSELGSMTGVSFYTKAIVNNILKLSPASGSGLAKGVPRGIGVSATLAEWEGRRIDAKLTCFPNLVYYARYVDDIIAVFSHSRTPGSLEYNFDKQNKVESAYRHFKHSVESIGFSLNDSKYFSCDIAAKASFKRIKYKRRGSKEWEVGFEQKMENTISFEFLGYKFYTQSASQKNTSGGGWLVDIADSKAIRIFRKINISFSEFQRSPQHSEDFSLLVTRLKVLTGGIYFFDPVKKRTYKRSLRTRYPHLSPNLECLKKLDKHIRWWVAIGLVGKNGAKATLPRLSKAQADKLYAMSFHSCYKRRTISKLSTNAISTASRCWTNER